MIVLAKNKSTPAVNKDEKAKKSVNPENEVVDNTSEAKNKSNPTETIQNDVVEQNAAELLSVEKDKYLRLAAEYDNYRKRSAKERDKIYTEARIDAISKLLPVYDNLERALKMECSDESYYKGVEMIMAQLTESLKSMGIQEIPAVGEAFDPNRHNAVMKIEDPELGENIIAEEFQKGFAIGDRVIRFSTVVVAN